MGPSQFDIVGDQRVYRSGAIDSRKQYGAVTRDLRAIVQRPRLTSLFARCYLYNTMRHSTTSLKLSRALKEKVGKLAQSVAQTPHAYMVEAISQKTERDEKREAFIKAALDSAEETKGTGLAYAHDDVWDYILRKARGQKARKPKPIKLPKLKR